LSAARLGRTIKPFMRHRTAGLIHSRPLPSGPGSGQPCACGPVNQRMPYWGMTQTQTYPYSLDVFEAPGGHFLWAIREHGRLLQRSDRSHPSERTARAKGESALESLLVARTRDKRN
jgi:hypothetical protein